MKKLLLLLALTALILASCGGGGIIQPLPAGGSLEITTGSPLPVATQNVAYTRQLKATGGSGAYVWTATGLPAGLSISSSGEIIGTPTKPGAYHITVTVKTVGQ